MLFSMTTTTFAANQPTTDTIEGYNFYNNSMTEYLSSAETEDYDKYNLMFTDTFMYSSESFTDRILSLFNVQSSKVIGNNLVKIYESNSISGLLPMSKKIVELSSINDFIYISYISTDNNEITLCYDDNGLNHKTIYNEDTDVLIYDDNNSPYMISNFRHGTYYEISDELLLLINECIENENLNPLYSIDSITLSENDNGIFIEPQIPTSRAVKGFDNETELKEDLESSFPPYSEQLKLTTSKYCSYLGRNIQIKVTETRNNYVKKTVEWYSFAADTAISVIGSWLGVKTSAVPNILSYIGVAVSLLNQIESAVTLSRSAAYTYTGRKSGYAYDITNYNTYVLVIRYSDTGEFHGGYDNNGNFTWIHYDQSTAFNKTDAQVAEQAIGDYNYEVTVNSGININYRP